MEKILDKLGFSEYKKRAYICLIRLEKAKVGEISKKARIPSSKIYEVMDWLYQNGYVSIVREKPLIFKANDPKYVLNSNVKSRMQELKELEKQISKINTDLDRSRKSDFQIIYGRDSFYKKVKESVAKSKSSIIAIVKSFRLDYELRELTQEFSKKGGNIRFLGPINDVDKRIIREWKRIGVNIRNYHPEMTRFTVWDGHIITIGLKDVEKDYYSLWIDNPYLGKILSDYFEKLWKKS